MDTRMIFDYIKKAFEATKAWFLMAFEATKSWFLMAWKTVRSAEFWAVPQVPTSLKKSKSSVKPKSPLTETSLEVKE
tara:strand:+ start:71 stop:301 length:231 start_codon:yes stop_codon:yes gene_type:complete